MPATLRRMAAETGSLDQHYWIDGGIEPSLTELLADPIMHAVMQADGLRLQEVLSAVALAGRRQRLAAVALR
jgi:hypothetical protein